MPREQKLSSLLKGLGKLLEDEAESNPEFAARLERLLAPLRPSSETRKKNGNKSSRAVVVPDVMAALEKQGEVEFRFWLRTFDLATLKAIVKSNGFDVTRASQKWTDPDKFLNLIFEQSTARLRRGSSFLPDSNNTTDKE